MTAYGLLKIIAPLIKSKTSFGSPQIYFKFEATDKTKQRFNAVFVGPEAEAFCDVNQLILESKSNIYVTAKLDQLIAVVNRKEKFIFANVAEIISITTNPN